MATAGKTVRSEIAIVDISAKRDKDNKMKGGSSKAVKPGDGEPQGKAQKRTHSEMSEASMEELNFIQEQLDTLTSELKETKEVLRI